MAFGIQEYQIDVLYKPGRLLVFPEALSRVPQTVSLLMKTVNMKEAKKAIALAYVVQERHFGYTETILGMKEMYWASKHHDVRSWISTCTYAFVKDGRKKKARCSSPS
jgi:hypothetical protein